MARLPTEPSGGFTLGPVGLSDCLSPNRFKLVAGKGVEPSSCGYEPRVLPLNYPAIENSCRCSGSELYTRLDTCGRRTLLSVSRLLMARQTHATKLVDSRGIEPRSRCLQSRNIPGLLTAHRNFRERLKAGTLGFAMPVSNRSLIYKPILPQTRKDVKDYF